jgi:hypothetical protein
MPILYNPSKTPRSIVLQDGSTRSVGGKKRFYIKPEELSGQILCLLADKKLFDKGGDPIASPEALTTGPKDGGVIIMIAADSTSSDIHQEYDTDSDIKDLSDQKVEVSSPASEDEAVEPVKNRKKKKKDLEE